MADTNKIFTEIAKIIASQLSIKENDVKENSTFDELGIDSVDRVEIIMKLEEAFNIEIKDEVADSFKTVKDIVEYISKAK